MSTSLTLVSSSPSWPADRAPGCENSRTLLTLAKVTSGCCSAACSKTGAKPRHGPHQGAQKSMIRVPSGVMASWKVSLVSSTMLMRVVLAARVGWRLGPVGPVGAAGAAWWMFRPWSVGETRGAIARRAGQAFAVRVDTPASCLSEATISYERNRSEKS
ncbi:Uncharacterised protein [Bordetella pertussis]|nr:Uncharacterised protein [Bordetella pertussis]